MTTTMTPTLRNLPDANRNGTAHSLRRYIVTAMGLLGGFGVDANPGLRDRHSKQAFERLNGSLSRLAYTLSIPDRQRVRAEYSTELSKLLDTMHQACTVLARYTLRVAKVTESPLDTLVSFAGALGTRIEDGISILEASSIPPATPRPLTAAADDDAAVRSLMEDAKAGAVRAEYTIPTSMQDRLRPDAAMAKLRCIVTPLSLEQKSQAAYSLWEVAALPQDMLPTPSQWLQLHTGVLSAFQDGMGHSVLRSVVTKKILLSKTKRAPVSAQKGTHTILSEKNSEFESQVELGISPGEPYTLEMRVTLSKSSVYGVLLSWIRGSSEVMLPVEDSVKSTNSKFVEDTQEALEAAYDKFCATFAHGEACARIGFAPNGDILLQADAWRVRQINLPRNAEDKARYLMDLHTDNRKVFGSREGLEKNAELIGNDAGGWRVVSVAEHRHLTRSVFCYGMTVWWAIPGPVYTSVVMKGLTSLFSLCGRTAGTAMSLEDLLEYMQEQGVTLENSGGSETSRVYDAARSLSSRIRSVLTDQDLVLPTSVQTSLKVLQIALEEGKVRNLEHLNTVIPSKLDYVSTSYRKASPVVFMDTRKLRSHLQSHLPSLDGTARKRLALAGIDPETLPGKSKLIEAVLIQASRDRSVYRRACPEFRVRVPCPPRVDLVPGKVIADVYSQGVGLVVRSGHRALEYEVNVAGIASLQ